MTFSFPWTTSSAALSRSGKGWKMLMSALAAGRGISLPSLSAGGCAFAAHVCGAYARIREQFNVPIGRFEAIQERLARIAANAYLLDAARRLTCAAIDHGHKPAVITAIMKQQATERLRVIVNDAMDIHGGKAVQEGPLNYLGSSYRGVPIGITVEGANIVTRALIQFGQGAIRSHPFLLREITALEDPDHVRALDAFDRAFWAHLGHSCANALRAFARAWTGGTLAPAPAAGAVRPFYRSLGRYASAFALAADVALLTLSAGLKRREMISARFGDILSELFLLSAVLKRWEDEGRQAADLPLVEWCMQSGFATIETRLDEILANLPIAAGGLAAALHAAAVRRAPPRPIRSIDAGLRPPPAHPIGHARPPHRGYLPRHRQQWACPPRARLRAQGCHRAVARPAAPGQGQGHREGAPAECHQRRRGGGSSMPPRKPWRAPSQSMILRPRNWRRATSPGRRAHRNAMPRPTAAE